MKYVALLRGVNVGGKGAVNMANLKTCFEQLGYEHVQTYINSGNVIFTAPAGSQPVLAERLEQAIEEAFGLHVKVLVKNLSEMQALVHAIPENWIDNKEQKCTVLFLWPEVDSEAMLEQLSWQAADESVRYYPGAIVWHTSKKFASKSRVLRINQAESYKQMTARNPNTVRKLLALMEAPGE